MSADKPAESCKDIKERYPETEDGVYWIDVNGGDPSDAMEVYCNMTFNGGGWTLVAFIKYGAPAHTNLWTEPYNVNEYKTDRADTLPAYSLGILDEMDDTEMLMLGGSSDPISALSINGLLQFKYVSSNPTFNNGPNPCTYAEFEYRKSLSEDYAFAKLNTAGSTSCRSGWWYVKDAGTGTNLMYIKNSTYFYIGAGHVSSWHYVRLMSSKLLSDYWMNKSRILLMLGILFLFGSNNAYANDYFVGATDAKLEVTPSGQASFSVPIKVPPGIASLVPQVSINYASGWGNGTVGLGGSLSGISSISRCSKTIAQDGVSRGPQLDQEDQFCLGGQRLVLVAGAHGAQGAEYRTAIESFQKIVITQSHSYPTGGASPLAFDVHNKGGGVVHYGLNPSERITDPDSGIVHIRVLSIVGKRVNYKMFTAIPCLSNTSISVAPALTENWKWSASRQRSVTAEIPAKASAIIYMSSSNTKPAQIPRIPSPMVSASNKPNA